MGGGRMEPIMSFFSRHRKGTVLEPEMQHDTGRISKGRGRRRRARKISNREVSASSSSLPSSPSVSHIKERRRLSKIWESLVGRSGREKKKKIFFPLRCGKKMKRSGERMVGVRRHPFSPEKKGGREEKKVFPYIAERGEKKDREEERKSLLLLLSPFPFLPPPPVVVLNSTISSLSL